LAPTGVIEGKTVVVETVVIQCRLNERGPGWATKMERTLLSDGRLLERNVLERPNELDVVVNRFFVRRPSAGGGSRAAAGAGRTGTSTVTEAVNSTRDGDAWGSLASTPASGVLERPQALQAVLSSAMLLVGCGVCCVSRSR
jgi:hypothetical protein